MPEVFFFGKEKMIANFQRIIIEDSLTGELRAFHDYLVRFAGKETFAEHACLTLAMACRLACGRSINLSKHLEAMIDDTETVKKAKQILENAAIITMAKRG